MPLQKHTSVPWSLVSKDFNNGMKTLDLDAVAMCVSQCDKTRICMCVHLSLTSVVSPNYSHTKVDTHTHTLLLSACLTYFATSYFEITSGPARAHSFPGFECRD